MEEKIHNSLFEVVSQIRATNEINSRSKVESKLNNTQVSRLNLGRKFESRVKGVTMYWKNANLSSQHFIDL